MVKNKEIDPTVYLLVIAFTIILSIAVIAMSKSDVLSILKNSVFPPPSPSPIAIIDTDTTYPLELRVLGIGLNPSQSGKDIATTYFSDRMNNWSASYTEDYIFDTTAESLRKVTHNTINPSIIKKIEIDEFPTYKEGYSFTVANYDQCVFGQPGFSASLCENKKKQFDTITWLKTNRICEQANETNADQIWLIAPPYITTYESFMIGPDTTYPVNGAEFIMEECNKSYLVITGTYERPEPMLHVLGHIVEATMAHITKEWTSGDRYKHWVYFSAVTRYQTPYSGALNTLQCGNAHFPANASKAYDYSNKKVMNVNCSDWENFPNYTYEEQSIDCSVWNCTEIGWHEYWLSSLPHRPGSSGINWKGGALKPFKNNWWYYILYPENTIAVVKQT